MSRRGDEQVQALEWAYGVASTQASLAAALDVPLDALPDRVWTDVAPRGVGQPLVILQVTDPTDRLALGALDRLGSVVPLIAKVVVEGPAVDPAAAPLRALYERLHGAQDEPIPGGGRMLTCRRTAGLAYPETTNGVQYRHLGHQFQVEID
jgi:hypothetical protein